ncbi:hypothetical protein XccvBFoX4_gp77 [Xanthomonas phage FoX4]|uniref:Uncharacterized protein n=1 Tax=Xanthomonas phage FoX4 TaxID=2723900 RepID=A0A858WLJ7_9CAUD|nr:hypothetical protein KNU97_gp77 [Xanthomonas phage FoX4]QJI53031.1 hypothetical protein XccvBFoX4_gp77 [Xanthomonas phage FoX4]
MKNRIYIQYGSSGTPMATTLETRVPASYIRSDKWTTITREDGARFQVLRNAPSRPHDGLRRSMSYSVTSLQAPYGWLVCATVQQLTHAIRNWSEVVA